VSIVFTIGLRAYMRIYKAGVIVSLAASAYLVATSIQIHTLPDFVSIVEDNRSSVVRIETEKAGDYEDEDKSRFEEFNEPEEDFEDEEGALGSIGSGFFISEDGYLITNTHVIQNSEKIMVKLWDRTKVEAELIGSDFLTDVALLKVDRVVEPVAIGNIFNLKVGQWVIALGSPYGHDYSATAGIISTIKRYTPDLYVPFIQSDVAVNPGNSGGPLFNGKGEVIGINSQIYSRTGSFAGITYSIPIDLALEVVSQLKKTGEFTRGLLGAVVVESEQPGALISKVIDQGSASRGDLRVGDIIVSFNNKSINIASALAPVVGLAPVGSPVSVTILRGTELINLFVFLDKKVEVELVEALAP